MVAQTAITFQPRIFAILSKRKKMAKIQIFRHIKKNTLMWSIAVIFFLTNLQFRRWQAIQSLNRSSRRGKSWGTRRRCQHCREGFRRRILVWREAEESEKGRLAFKITTWSFSCIGLLKIIFEPKSDKRSYRYALNGMTMIMGQLLRTCRNLAMRVHVLSFNKNKPFALNVNK